MTAREEFEAGWRAAVAWIETEIHKDGDEFRDLPEIIADAWTPR